MRKLLSMLLAIVLMMSMTSTAFAATKMEGIIITLEKLDGDGATITNKVGKELALKEGARIVTGYTIKTDDKTVVYLSLDSKTSVVIERNSSVTIQKKGSKNEIYINAGEVAANVSEKLEGSEELNIATSNMVMGVRGTSVSVSQLPMTNGTSSTRAVVYTGLAVVTPAGGTPVDFPSGRKVTVVNTGDGTNANTFEAIFDDLGSDDISPALARITEVTEGLAESIAQNLNLSIDAFNNAANLSVEEYGKYVEIQAIIVEELRAQIEAQRNIQNEYFNEEDGEGSVGATGNEENSEQAESLENIFDDLEHNDEFSENIEMQQNDYLVVDKGLSITGDVAVVRGSTMEISSTQPVTFSGDITIGGQVIVKDNSVLVIDNTEFLIEAGEIIVEEGSEIQMSSVAALTLSGSAKLVISGTLVPQGQTGRAVTQPTVVVTGHNAVVEIKEGARIYAPINFGIDTSDGKQGASTTTFTVYEGFADVTDSNGNKIHDHVLNAFNATLSTTPKVFSSTSSPSDAYLWFLVSTDVNSSMSGQLTQEFINNNANKDGVTNINLMLNGSADEFVINDALSFGNLSRFEFRSVGKLDINAPMTGLYLFQLQNYDETGSVITFNNSAKLDSSLIIFDNSGTQPSNTSNVIMNSNVIENNPNDEIFYNEGSNVSKLTMSNITLTINKPFRFPDADEFVLDKLKIVNNSTFSFNKSGAAFDLNGGVTITNNGTITGDINLTQDVLDGKGLVFTNNAGGDYDGKITSNYIGMSLEFKGAVPASLDKTNFNGGVVATDVVYNWTGSEWKYTNFNITVNSNAQLAQLFDTATELNVPGGNEIIFAQPIDNANYILDGKTFSLINGATMKIANGVQFSFGNGGSIKALQGSSIYYDYDGNGSYDSDEQYISQAGAGSWDIYTTALSVLHIDSFANGKFNGTPLFTTDRRAAVLKMATVPEWLNLELLRVAEGVVDQDLPITIRRTTEYPSVLIDSNVPLFNLKVNGLVLVTESTVGSLEIQGPSFLDINRNLTVNGNILVKQPDFSAVQFTDYSYSPWNHMHATNYDTRRAALRGDIDLNKLSGENGAKIAFLDSWMPSASTGIFGDPSNGARSPLKLITNVFYNGHWYSTIEFQSELDVLANDLKAVPPAQPLTLDANDYITIESGLTSNIDFILNSGSTLRIGDVTYDYNNPSFDYSTTIGNWYSNDSFTMGAEGSLTLKEGATFIFKGEALTAPVNMTITNASSGKFNLTTQSSGSLGGVFEFDTAQLPSWVESIIVENKSTIKFPASSSADNSHVTIDVGIDSGVEFAGSSTASTMTFGTIDLDSGASLTIGENVTLNSDVLLQKVPTSQYGESQNLSIKSGAYFDAARLRLGTGTDFALNIIENSGTLDNAQAFINTGLYVNIGGNWVTGGITASDVDYKLSSGTWTIRSGEFFGINEDYTLGAGKQIIVESGGTLHLSKSFNVDGSNGIVIKDGAVLSHASSDRNINFTREVTLVSGNGISAPFLAVATTNGTPVAGATTFTSPVIDSFVKIAAASGQNITIAGTTNSDVGATVQTGGTLTVATHDTLGRVDMLNGSTLTASGVNYTANIYVQGAVNIVGDASATINVTNVTGATGATITFSNVATITLNSGNSTWGGLAAVLAETYTFNGSAWGK